MRDATLGKRRKYEEFLAQVPILTPLDRYERLALSDALATQTFSAGDKIVTEGDSDTDSFYLIMSGEAKGTKEGEADEVCARLTRGSYFGEVRVFLCLPFITIVRLILEFIAHLQIALLKDKPRAVTITAVTDVKCAVCDRKAFDRMLGPLEDILKRNMELYEQFNI